LNAGTDEGADEGAPAATRRPRDAMLRRGKEKRLSWPRRTPAASLRDMNAIQHPRFPLAACRPLKATACTALLAAVVSLGACGGGGGGGETSPPPTPSPPAGPTLAQRTAAATPVAGSASNDCAPIRPFYWEVGDRSAAQASGSVGGNTYAANTAMSIASATKWLYGAYVAERRSGVFTAQDVEFLSFKSGYTDFDTCLPGQTVASCLAAGSNGDFVPSTQGRFFYGGGHMQKHATLLGLGAMDNAALAAEMRSVLGTDIGLAFSQPQPAGGAISSAADYAVFLRKLLVGGLRHGVLLGQASVCTNPLACPGQALYTPVPSTEQWRYGTGHWVEADPVVGDGAFSSAGAFGFYPWIDASRSVYGVVARRDITAGAGNASARCGRLIRKAWLTGSS